MKTITQYLNEVKARCEGANRGPWRMWAMSVYGPKPGTAEDDAELDHAQLIANTSDEERGLRTFNGTFIARARTDLPRLERWLREAVGLLERFSNGEGPYPETSYLLARIEKEVGDG